MAKCTYCGKKLKNSASFCHGCGKAVVQNAPVPKTSIQPKRLTAGAIATILIAVILFAVVVLPIVSRLIAEGPEFGRWEENDILRDFNSILRGRKSEYQKLMAKMQYIGLGISILGCLPLYFFLTKSKKLDQISGGQGLILTLPGVICSAILLTCWFLLWLFDFVGTPRIVILVLFFVIALIWLAVMILNAIVAKGYGILVMLLSSALGFAISAYLAAFAGAGAVIFGDLFWIFFGILVLFGGGGSGGAAVVHVHVHVW